MSCPTRKWSRRSSKPIVDLMKWRCRFDSPQMRHSRPFEASTCGQCRSGAAFWQESLVHNDQREERCPRTQVLTSAARKAAWADHRYAEDGDKEAVGNRSQILHSRGKGCVSPRRRCGSAVAAIRYRASAYRARESCCPRVACRGDSPRRVQPDRQVADRFTGSAGSQRSGTQSIEVCRSSTSSACSRLDRRSVRRTTVWRGASR